MLLLISDLCLNKDCAKLHTSLLDAARNTKKRTSHRVAILGRYTPFEDLWLSRYHLWIRLHSFNLLLLFAGMADSARR